MLHSELFTDILTDKNCDASFLNDTVDLQNNFQDYLDLTLNIILYIETNRPENCHENIKEFLKRVIALKMKIVSANILDRIDFLLLRYTSEIMVYYNRTGHFHFCYDVIALGIFDKTFVNGEQIELTTYRIFKHLGSYDKNVQTASLETIVSWLGQFYYYSRSFSGFNDFGNLMIEETMEVITENEMGTAPYSFLISNAYSWCELNRLKTEAFFLSNKITQLNNKIDGNSNILYAENIKLEIILKSVFNEAIKKSTALDLKDHQWSDPISRAQFFIHVYIANLLTDFNLDDLSNEIALINHDHFHHSRLDMIHEMSRFSKILNPFIIHCIKYDKYDDLNTILGVFYQSSLDEKSILYCVPNSSEGSFLFDKTTKYLHEFNAATSIPGLVKLQNLALNQFTILKGSVYENDVPTKEIGMPEYKHGAQFELLLSKLYNFKPLVDKNDKELKSYFQFGYNSFPIQAIMIKSIESVLPRQVSFKHKNDFSKTAKVLFWKGNSFSSDIEFNCVKEILEMHNIEVILCKPTKQDFLEQLAEDFHIIWVSTHGEHRHYSPFASKIVLDDNIEISLCEFESLLNPYPDTRRLFFCNICEGGKTAQTGDLVNVGFPAVLTAANQDYLSHLWMIDFRFAMIYGAIFAVLIGEGNDHIQAYNHTVLTLLKGKESIMEKLQPYTTGNSVSGLIDTISNMDNYDFSNILYWGSSAYYV
jgi:hypothetical protein